MTHQTPRILALFGSGVIFGAERANAQALKALQDTGCTVHVLVREEGWARRSVDPFLDTIELNHTPAPFLQNRVPNAGFSFFIRNPVRFALAPVVFAVIAKKFRPTHVHVGNSLFYLSFIQALETRSIPIVYRIGDKPEAHNALWRWLWRRIAKRTAHFVADSEFIARELEALGVPRRKITVIFTSPAARSNPPQPNLRPDNPQQILFIGQISADKGVDRLIEAFRQVAEEFPKARLTVVGRISDWAGDDWQRALRDATREDPFLRGRIDFPGETDDIYDYLAASAFLVVPSVIEEAFGLVVGEAKAAGRPCVVFPSGGLPEQIVHGEDGFVCSDTSVQALGEGLRYYLSDPDRALAHGRAALASLQHLGGDRFSTRWREVYDQTMSTLDAREQGPAASKRAASAR